MYQRNYLLLLLLLAVCHGLCAQQVIPVSRYGIRPDTRADMSPRIQKMLKDLRKRTAQGEEVVLQFAPGRYDFHPDRAAERTYYISNHDQDNPKRVGIPLEGLKNVTLDGGGASFVFHGRMLPLSLLESEGCTLKNFSIDFENPHIAQVRILSADTLNGVVFRPEPWVQWRLTPDSVFEAYGEGWTVRHSWGVVFEDSTKRLVYNSGDRACPTQGARLTDGGDIHAPRWKDAVLKPGMRFVMRGWGRPTPGIFLYKDKDTHLENIRIHYAEGMGVLAQVCEDITLDRLSVCLKGKDDPRSFTTQADATHFSRHQLVRRPVRGHDGRRHQRPRHLPESGTTDRRPHAGGPLHARPVLGLPLGRPGRLGTVHPRPHHGTGRHSQPHRLHPSSRPGDGRRGP